MGKCQINIHKTIYLGSGCFWGVEKYFDMQKGVVACEVGYANGITKNPTYEEVCTGKTEFAEVVRVTYDSGVIDLLGILAHFYEIVDPTTANRQGPDVGSQYRPGVYFTDPAEQAVIASSLADLQKSYDKPIVVENLPLKNYYKAEEYHQKYLDKNPGGFCHIPKEKFG
ncbi:MAG: peptide-methionine (S)-S-oxide reductase MsrA [Defluviitaleaceae bacterium]|nr:peptide-methionine (S)-S-oxide reductase MsrA [Defluviitaleaceae bacterium]